ncbi:hypothetical protein DYB25_012990 [Aphanomyces astaci]|uniref:MULE transposase domain-containing protein n=1 Tax=Aphanomyces astaci TaxID=112090 RepID=A0A396ZPR7_APHAT|nr:hypothetical protein DYB25_012990 [Aphanomyces astaci]
MGVHNAKNEKQRMPKVTPEMKVAFRGWLHQDTMRTPKDMLRLLKEALAKQEIALLGNELLPTLQQIQGAVKTIRCKEFGHLSTTEAAEAELAKWVSLQVFPAIQYLMCFFHVMQKCWEHGRQMEWSEWDAVTEDIYFLHMSSSRDMLDVRMRNVHIKWGQGSVTMQRFRNYFYRQWLPPSK